MHGDSIKHFLLLVGLIYTLTPTLLFYFCHPNITSNPVLWFQKKQLRISIYNIMGYEP